MLTYFRLGTDMHTLFVCQRTTSGKHLVITINALLSIRVYIIRCVEGGGEVTVVRIGWGLERIAWWLRVMRRDIPLQGFSWSWLWVRHYYPLTKHHQTSKELVVFNSGKIFTVNIKIKYCSNDHGIQIHHFLGLL